MAPEKEKALLVVRPFFDQGLTMIYAMGAGALGTLVGTVMGGSLLYFLLSLLGLDRFIGVGYLFGLALVFCIVVIPPLFFEIRKKALGRTSYRFYKNHLEFDYYQFLLQPRSGQIRYSAIQDVYQSASGLQAHQKLTTIYLYVPGLQHRQAGFAGLEMKDVEQKPDYMNQILNIMDGRATETTPETTQVATDAT